ncbi:MAG: HAD family phosphatase, partial [Cutibacterium sp.]|nr:HAD family phosphatase [Cutibacterium sp.]
MIALIATDLDGTFLGADKLPSAENTEAMFAAADAGVHVVFATGRPYRWLT